MRIDEMGSKENPVMLMFPGSFCSAKSMEPYATLLAEDNYLIMVTLDGCDGTGTDYVSNDDMAKKVLKEVQNRNVKHIRMLYGISMGAANALQFLQYAQKNGIQIDHIMMDGPAVGRINPFMRWFFDFMNKKQVKMMHGLTIDEYLATPMIQKMAQGRPEVYRVYMEDMLTVSNNASKQTSDAITATCCDFRFPEYSEDVQRRTHIWYGKDAMKMFFFKGLKKAFPKANYKDTTGYGHAMYAVEAPEQYVKELREIYSK